MIKAFGQTYSKEIQFVSEKEDIRIQTPEPYEYILRYIVLSDGVIIQCAFSRDASDVEKRRGIYKVNFNGDILWRIEDRVAVWEKIFSGDDSIWKEKKLDFLATVRFYHMYIKNEYDKDITGAYMGDEKKKEWIKSMKGIVQSDQAKVVVEDYYGASYILDTRTGKLIFWKPKRFYDRLSIRQDDGQEFMFFPPEPYVFMLAHVKHEDGYILIFHPYGVEDLEKVRRNIIKIDKKGNTIWRVADTFSIWKERLADRPDFWQYAEKRAFSGITIAEDDIRVFGEANAVYQLNPENGDVHFLYMEK